MKKNLILTFAFSVLFSTMIAQENISNPGFELWNNSTPTDWSISLNGNILTEVLGVEVPIPISEAFGAQTTDAHSGNYALTLHPAVVGFSEVSMTFPGMGQLGSTQEFNLSSDFITSLTSGSYDISDADLAELHKIIAGGVPFTQSPSAIKVWIKFQPAEYSTDFVDITAFTSRWDASTNSYIEVASGELTISEAVNEYTQFTIPMELEDAASTCDTLRFVITVGSDESNVNSMCYVDDITFEYGNSINENESVDLYIYPNPTSDQLNIAPANTSIPYSIQIVDVNGKIIVESKDLISSSQINTSNLSNGIYFLKFNQNNQSTVKKVIIK